MPTLRPAAAPAVSGPGQRAPSNAYLSEAALRAPEVWFPLRVLVCTHCWLVQTEDHAGREALFTHDYAYFSSFSTSWLAHAKAYVQAMQQRLDLGAGSCVVEVASNDGYLLQYVQQAGIPCYGIEPTASTAKAARVLGLTVVERFFGMALADELAGAGRQADLIAANNVLAHVPDINDFVAGFARLLKPQGVATFEFPHLLRMVQGCQFDTAYHEHYSYLSLTAVQRILGPMGWWWWMWRNCPPTAAACACCSPGRRRCPPPGHTRRCRPRGATAGHGSGCGPAGRGFYSDFQPQALRIKREMLSFLLQCQADGLTVGPTALPPRATPCSTLRACGPTCCPMWWTKTPPSKANTCRAVASPSSMKPTCASTSLTGC